jgi:hypothetical protein
MALLGAFAEITPKCGKREGEIARARSERGIARRSARRARLGDLPDRQSGSYDREDARPGNRARRSQPAVQQSGGRSSE